MELNSNYRIVYDSDNTILQYFEQREKTVYDALTRKHIGTGEFKEHTVNYYYPSLKTALNGFLIKCLWDTETATDLLEKLERLEKLIKSIKNE